MNRKPHYIPQPIFTVSLHFDVIKKHVHSIAVQALAGGTISSLKTQIAFITTVVDNLPTNFLNAHLTHWPTQFMSTLSYHTEQTHWANSMTHFTVTHNTLTQYTLTHFHPYTLNLTYFTLITWTPTHYTLTHWPSTHCILTPYRVVINE